MAFTSGTATDYQDLLLKLKDYLALQGWTVLDWTQGATLTDESTLRVQGPGAGADKHVFVNIKANADTTNSYYYWRVRAACSYDAAAAWGMNLSEQPASSYLNLWENAIDYWFYVNDRRFMVVAKCGTNYMSLHSGFILPWGTPDTYPFPLFTSADYYASRAYSYNYASRRMFVDPGGGSDALAAAWARTAAGLWYPIVNEWDSSNTNYASGQAKGQRGWTWPYQCGYGASNASGGTNTGAWTGGHSNGDFSWVADLMTPTQQGERPLFPVMICAGDQAPLGVVDGAYALSGSGLVPGQLITIGARNFRVFQNIQRNSPDDFFCIEEI